MKRALVTGGSGAIGAAICATLARGGPSRVRPRASRIDEARRDRAAHRRRRRVGGGGRVRRGRSRRRRSAAPSPACSTGGAVQILVNNAGTHDDAPLAGMTLAQWQACIDVTLHGFFNVTQPLLMPMIRARWGRIVNIASVAAHRRQPRPGELRGGEGRRSIAAGKSLAQEIARKGVTVNAVAPGIIETPMTRARVRRRAHQAQLVPMRRAGHGRRGGGARGLPRLRRGGLHYRPGACRSTAGCTDAACGRHSGLQRGAHDPRRRGSARCASRRRRHRRRRRLDRRHRARARGPAGHARAHAANLGKAAALWSGFDVGAGQGADYVATLDGDGQHDPADLPRLVQASRSCIPSASSSARGCSIARNAPLSRRVANRFADFWISWAAGHPIADSQSGERLYPGALAARASRRAHDRDAVVRVRKRGAHPRRAAAASRASPCRFARSIARRPAQPLPPGARHRAHRAHGGARAARARPLSARDCGTACAPRRSWSTAARTADGDATARS